MVEVSQQDKREDLLTTLDTGSKYNIVDEGEANTRSWHISKITEWEKPSLKCPDGRKLEIVGKTTLWLHLAKEEYKRKIDFFVTPHLQSEILVGLIDLKRLHWSADVLSGRHFVSMTFCQRPGLDVLSGRHLVSMTFCQEDILSGNFCATYF